MKTKKNIEVWQDHDRTGEWVLHIQKKKGSLTLDEIREAAAAWDQGFYFLLIRAMDDDMDQYYMTEDLDGDFVTLYRSDDFQKWREK